MTRKLLLLCGIASSILYVATDLLAEIFYGQYHSFTSQAVSELMARGAPTEGLVDPLFLIYGVLLTAFGVAVWMSAGPKRLLHLSAGSLIGSAALGFLGPTFFEMNVRGSGGDPRADVLHIVLTFTLVLFILLAVGFGAFVRGPWFRTYSLATIAIMILFGVLASLAGREMAGGGPTPWFGLFERVNIGAYLLWVAVLGISLLREERSTAMELSGSGTGLRTATARVG